MHLPGRRRSPSAARNLRFATRANGEPVPGVTGVCSPRERCSLSQSDSSCATSLSSGDGSGQVGGPPSSDCTAQGPSTSPKEPNGSVAMKAQRVMSPRHTAHLQPGDRVVICGAGPARPYRRLHPCRQGPSGHRARGRQHRGGARSHGRVQGVSFDIGGHGFFTQLPAVQALWWELLGNELIDVPRLSRIISTVSTTSTRFRWPTRCEVSARRSALSSS